MIYSAGRQNERMTGGGEPARGGGAEPGRGSGNENDARIGHGALPFLSARCSQPLIVHQRDLGGLRCRLSWPRSKPFIGSRDWAPIMRLPNVLASPNPLFPSVFVSSKRSFG